ncbi:hypothetical protein, partial [Erythrobacter sp. HI0028]|uniref:hypothetical protein n=1 Tax=Erythrobacter sp. HI0028 TaxID=1822227 RepID=UPI001F1A93EF
MRAAPVLRFVPGFARQAAGIIERQRQRGGAARTLARGGEDLVVQRQTLMCRQPGAPPRAAPCGQRGNI